MTGEIKDLNQKERGKEGEIALFIVKYALWEQNYIQNINIQNFYRDMTMIRMYHPYFPYKKWIIQRELFADHNFLKNIKLLSTIFF